MLSKSRYSVNSTKGFTLLELLIAMFVFSILASFSFKAVGFLADLDILGREEAQLLTNLQRAALFLQRDAQENKIFLSDPNAIEGTPSSSGGLGQIEYILSANDVYRKEFSPEKNMSKELNLKLISSVESFSLDKLGEAGFDFKVRYGNDELFHRIIFVEQLGNLTLTAAKNTGSLSSSAAGPDDDVGTTQPSVVEGAGFTSDPADSLH